MSATELPSWAPPGVDLDRPSAARVYDYYLGGACNFEVDRAFAKKILAEVPEVRESAILNRAFLRRAVRYCAQQGIRQFLDIGSGIPTVGHTHEIARSVDPGCRVLYVDNEPTAVAHGELLLAGDKKAACIKADMHEPERILERAHADGLIDPDQPTAVLMLLVLHFVLDDDVVMSLVAKYRDALAPGSYLVLSHGTADGLGQRSQQGAEEYKNSQNPLVLRNREQVTALFDGFEFVDPGLAYAAQWRPESEEEAAVAERSQIWAGVGVKR